MVDVNDPTKTKQYQVTSPPTMDTSGYLAGSNAITQNAASDYYGMAKGPASVSEYSNIGGGYSESDMPQANEYWKAQPGIPSSPTITNFSSPTPSVAQAQFTQPPTMSPRNVGSNELVSAHLTNLLDTNGKYIQQARNNAMITSAARGLQNSSIAAGSGEKAAIESALPIAQQDAQTYANSAQSAQESTQQARLAQLDGEIKAALSAQDYQQVANLERVRGSIQSELETQSQQNKASLASQQAGYEAGQSVLSTRLNSWAQTKADLQKYQQELGLAGYNAENAFNEDTNKFLQSAMLESAKSQDTALQNAMTDTYKAQNEFALEYFAQNMVTDRENQKNYVDSGVELLKQRNTDLYNIDAMSNDIMSPEQKAQAKNNIIKRTYDSLTALADIYGQDINVFGVFSPDSTAPGIDTNPTPDTAMVLPDGSAYVPGQKTNRFFDNTGSSFETDSSVAPTSDRLNYLKGLLA